MAPELKALHEQMIAAERRDRRPLWIAIILAATLGTTSTLTTIFVFRTLQNNAVSASKAQCVVSHLSRAALVDLINRENAPVQIPADASPEFRAALEKQNQDNEEYREKTIGPLRQLSCKSVGDVPAPAPQPLPPVASPSPVPVPMVLRGPQGPQGEAGKDGKNGVDGRPGHDGKDGAPGAVVLVPAPSPTPSPEPSPAPSPSPEPSPIMGIPLPLPSPTDTPSPVCVLEVCL